MIKHVWFDVEGVLYKTGPQFKTAHDEFLYSRLSRVLNEQDFTKVKQIHGELYKRYGSNSAVFRALGKASDYWHKSWESFDMERLIEPDKEVTPALVAIKTKLPISIFSNFRIGRIRKILARLEVPENYFSYILDSDDIPERKPNLAGFYKMIELSGVSSNQVVYVGDREETDIIPAKKAGMLACMIYGKSAMADINVSSFAELKTAVLNYN